MKLVLRWSPTSWQPSRMSEGKQLHCPLPQLPRTAILVPGYPDRKNVRVFPQGYSPAVEAFQPELLAAHSEELLRICQLVERREACLQLTHAVIAFSRADGFLLTAEQRDRIWDVLQVPIFEQLLSTQGELLAAECDAHDGLHLVQDAPGAHLAIALQARMEHAECACGEPSRRLVPSWTTPLPIRVLATAGGR